MTLISCRIIKKCLESAMTRAGEESISRSEQEAHWETGYEEAMLTGNRGGRSLKSDRNGDEMKQKQGQRYGEDQDDKHRPGWHINTGKVKLCSCQDRGEPQTVRLHDSPFTQLLQDIKDFLWLLGETVLAQLLQLSAVTERTIFRIFVRGFWLFVSSFAAHDHSFCTLHASKAL